MAFDPSNLATPTVLALYITWKDIVPALLGRKNGNGACKAAGALGSMDSETFSMRIGQAIGKEVGSSMDRNTVAMDRLAASQEQNNRNIDRVLNRLEVESEFRRRDS